MTLPALLPARGSRPLSCRRSTPGGPASVRELADETGAAFQAALVDLVASRRSVWLG